MMRKMWIFALAVAAVAAPARAADLNNLTPADAQAIVVFNVRQALDSPLAKKKGLTDLIKSGIDGKPEAKAVMTALGLDLTRDIQSVAIALGSLNDIQDGKKPEKLLIMVRGNFDPARIDAAAKKADTVKVSKEGNVTVYELKDKDDTSYATLIGKNMIAASPSKTYLLGAVKNIGGGSKELAKATAKVDAKQSIWMAIVITKEMREKMAQGQQFKDIAPSLESLTAGVNVTADIVLDVNINTSDGGKAATEMAKQINMAKPFVTAFLGGDDSPQGMIAKELVGNLKVTANQTALNLNLKINEAILDKIIKVASGK